jgi:hypothetical protein
LNEQLVALSYLDLIMQNAHLVSDDNRLRLADLARRNILPRDAIRRLQKAGILSARTGKFSVIGRGPILRVAAVKS